MNINFFESIIEKHIVITYNKTSIIENLDLKSFFWHSKKNLKDEYIFFAIKGNNTDGNLFIPDAIKNGYKIIISDNISKIEEYKDLYKEIYFIYVNSIQAVLDDLASYGINNYFGKKIAITGSAGKTTTTYILNNLLKNFGTVTTTDKYNSQYYLRRLMFHLFETKNDFFLAELSSDSLGTIEHYGNLIKPDYSIITSIGEAHVKDFLSLKNIIKEKTSLINHTLKKVFIPAIYKDLIINEDNVKNNLHKIVFVEEDYEDMSNKWIQFKLKEKKTMVLIDNLVGDHNYSNINLVLKLLDEMGLINNKTINLIDNTLENLTAFPGRGNRITIDKNNFDFQIICEHHNSNPLSFSAALENISEYSNTLVIMGFMYSLGENSDARHYELLNTMKNHPGIKYILTYDKNIYKLNLDKYEKVLIKNLEGHEDFFSILKNLLEKFKNEDIQQIFIKGSRSSKLEDVIKYILDVSN